MSSSSLPMNGNPYAPPWMRYSRVLAGIRDRENDFDLPAVSVPAGQFALNNKLPVDADADFLLRDLQFVVSAASGNPLLSDLRVRIRDGDGRMYTTDYVPIVDMCGPLVPPLPLRGGSVPIIDYQNVGAVTSSVWALLKTWKRILCPADPFKLDVPPQPMYACYKRDLRAADFDDFEYPFSFTATGAVDLPKQPLQTDNDADFLWCGLAGDWNTANNDVATVGSVAMTFYDTEGIPLQQAPLATPWNSLLAGQFRESVLSSGGGRPAPHFPPIFIPRGGVVLVDLSFGGAATTRFSLRGYKIYSGVCK